MKHSMAARLTALVLLATPGVLAPAIAQTQSPSGQPSEAGVFYTVDAAATVETVDPQARQVLLRLPDDSLVTLTVGPDVRNVAQLKPGDHVRARYIEAAVARLASPANEASQTALHSGSGGQVQGVGNVVAVDRSRNTVSIQAPHNTVQTITVHDPAMQHLLATLKVGDAVEVAYTEGVAISLDPAV
jgi:hypothetical protein